jgi:hypothetical protein
MSNASSKRIAIGYPSRPLARGIQELAQRPIVLIGTAREGSGWKLCFHCQWAELAIHRSYPPRDKSFTAVRVVCLSIIDVLVITLSCL